MEITGVKIKNYRSIKNEISIDLKKINKRSSFILLGINESGKSSILKGINLLNKSADFSYNDDCNSELEEEKKDIVITFELKIEDSVCYNEYFSENGIDKEIAEKIKISQISRLIQIDSSNKRKDFFYIWIDDDKIFSDYVLINKAVPIQGGTASKNIIEKRTADNVEGTGEDSNILNKTKLEGELEKMFFDFLDDQIPEPIFWKDEPRYLINEKIVLNDFKNDYSLSLPLKNCFRIAGVMDIKSKIESLDGKSNKIGRLKKELDRSVTEHVNSVWKEHEVQIEFHIDSTHIEFQVTDKDNDLSSFSVDQRSDGFKQFISILLNLSIENETSELKNQIILLDEPENHLHPSGQKYLMSEFLKIGINNIIIYSTHSIYMVDKICLDRHFSIEKKLGITNVNQIDSNNPYKEEVLYEALGTTILEHIQSNVIIFEGKTDRDIFDLYIKKFKTVIKAPNISLISGDGCDNIWKYTKFFNKNIIKGFVLTDSDKEGVICKIRVRKDTGYTTKNTFEINEILNTKKESTLEDLFDELYMRESVSEYYNGTMLSLDENEPLLKQVYEQLHTLKIPCRDKDKEQIKKIFFKKICSLKKVDLEKQKYYTFCGNFITKIRAI